MAKIKKFEEIKSWKKARTLTKEIYEVTSNGNFQTGLRSQRSAQASFGFYSLKYCGRL